MLRWSRDHPEPPPAALRAIARTKDLAARLAGRGGGLLYFRTLARSRANAWLLLISVVLLTVAAHRAGAQVPHDPSRLRRVAVLHFWVDREHVQDPLGGIKTLIYFATALRARGVAFVDVPESPVARVARAPDHAEPYRLPPRLAEFADGVLLGRISAWGTFSGGGAPTIPTFTWITGPGGGRWQAARQIVLPRDRHATVFAASIAVLRVPADGDAVLAWQYSQVLTESHAAASDDRPRVPDALAEQFMRDVAWRIPIRR